MASKNLFEEICVFKSSQLKNVETNVTTKDGRKFVETLNQGGMYSSTNVGVGQGYVLDMVADITVALVLPGLILGSQDVAMEPKILTDFNVTHILNVGYHIPNYFEHKYVYKKVEILDVPESNIRTFFEGCFQFIDDGRQEGCVLVHCNAGVSRAPTIVIAYLMNSNKMRLREALDMVKRVRSSVRPNDGFMKALEEYDRELFENRTK